MKENNQQNNQENNQENNHQKYQSNSQDVRHQNNQNKNQYANQRKTLAEAKGVSSKINYDQLMTQEIDTFGESRPTLLLHCCCAPCSSAVLERLTDYFRITLLFFNPNIFPEAEFFKRKAEFVKLGVEVVDLGYNHTAFLDAVRGKESEREGGDRCKVCIRQRMEESFRYAKAHNFDYATTTLSISPHKDALFINQTGEQLATQYGVKFLHSDFKKRNGYLRSIELCRNLGIYRQDYCGCEFSFHRLEE